MLVGVRLIITLFGIIVLERETTSHVDVVHHSKETLSAESILWLPDMSDEHENMAKVDVFHR